MKMNTRQIAEVLTALLEQDDENEDSILHQKIRRMGVLSFRDAGIMSGNEGVVLRMKSGDEFQITVVKSA